MTAVVVVGFLFLIGTAALVGDAVVDYIPAAVWDVLGIGEPKEDA